MIMQIQKPDLNKPVVCPLQCACSALRCRTVQSKSCVVLRMSCYLTDMLFDAEIPSLIFVTKIDKYDPDVIGADLTKTFHSSRLLQLFEASANFEAH